MNRATFLTFLALILLIAGGTIWYLTSSHEKAIENRQPIVGEGATVAEGQAIYTNGTHGFSVFYPESATVDYSFDPTYHLASTWRASALPDSTGTPVVSFIPYSVKSDSTYPRYYIAMVRIGVSEDPKEIASCLEPTKDQGETELPDRVINGTTWKAFSFENAGMMQYARGISYRSIHEEKCVALEQIRTGSSYRDEPKAEDIDDSVLDKAYEDLDAIVAGVTFVR
ncbi:MAG: hypothetical protein AB199_02585 [Parcubacteria bacterium C7867-004]|nr:MAG: hypothetical protein AB199_02585 [Parcubacteria bacterium C7867-004]